MCRPPREQGQKQQQQQQQKKDLSWDLLNFLNMPPLLPEAQLKQQVMISTGWLHYVYILMSMWLILAAWFQHTQNMFSNIRELVTLKLYFKNIFLEHFLKAKYMN